jgi:predicted transcriptional regulator
MAKKLAADMFIVQHIKCREAGLKSGQRSVLLEIAVRANGKWQSWPSLETISKGTGYSRSYVSETVQLLVQMGFISKRKRRRKTSVYTILEVPQLRTSKPSLDVPQTCTSKPILDVPQTVTTKTTSKHPDFGVKTSCNSIRELEVIPQPSRTNCTKQLTDNQKPSSENKRITEPDSIS